MANNADAIDLMNKVTDLRAQLKQRDERIAELETALRTIARQTYERARALLGR